MPQTPLVLPLIKGDRTVNNADYRDALPVNFTVVERNILGAQGYILSHPGLTSFATGLGVDRGGYWNERQNTHFRVSGTNLIDVSDSGSVSSLGNIPGVDRASMVHSFNTQAIVASNRMWLFDGANLNEVTDSDLGDPIDVTWIDGYYFLTDGEFLYHTDLSDETAIDPLKFATSEFSPDPTLAVDKTSDNQVIVFNRYTTEYFINRATDNFAFRRIDGKAVKCGVVGTHCETELEGTFYIIGGGREEKVSIHRIAAGTYTSIATREVDKILAEYVDEELSSAILETRVEDRDRFLVASLPRHTLLYNLSIAKKFGNDNAWTIVKSDINSDIPWRGINGVNDPRVGWVYGDRMDTNIGKLDNTVATQYGNAVECLFFTPLVNLEGMSIDEMEIDTIPGHQVNVGNVTCAISLTYNGLTYGKEWWALYGVQSKYGLRFIQRRLGYVRHNVGFKVRCASPERVAFVIAKIIYG